MDVSTSRSSTSTSPVWPPSVTRVTCGSLPFKEVKRVGRCRRNHPTDAPVGELAAHLRFGCESTIALVSLRGPRCPPAPVASAMLPRKTEGLCPSAKPLFCLVEPAGIEPVISTMPLLNVDNCPKVATGLSQTSFPGKAQTSYASRLPVLLKLYTQCITLKGFI